MKTLIKKFFKKLGSGVIIGIGATLGIGIIGLVYALVDSTWTSPSSLEVGAGSPLSTTSWNKLLSNFNNLNDKVSNFTFNGGNVGIGVNPNSKLEVNGAVKSLNTPKAWVAFNGETLAIYASYNVSSITRASVINAAGAYKINYTAPLSDINYAVMGSCNAWQFAGTMFTVEGNAISGSTYQGLFTNYSQVGCRISSTNVGADSNYVTAVIYDN